MYLEFADFVPIFIVLAGNSKGKIMLCHIVFMHNVFCFNQTAIVLHYSAQIKPCKTIKTIKTENITHKHNMTLIVSSQSIAVNK